MKRQGIIGPLILIAAGSILLLNNLGFLSWGLWEILWNFWPVILILAGLDVIVSHTESKSTYILGVIIGLLVIVGVIALAWVGFPSDSHAPRVDFIDDFFNWM